MEGQKYESQGHRSKVKVTRSKKFLMGISMHYHLEPLDVPCKEMIAKYHKGV